MTAASPLSDVDTFSGCRIRCQQKNEMQTKRFRRGHQKSRWHLFDASAFSPRRYSAERYILEIYYDQNIGVTFQFLESRKKYLSFRLD